MHGKGLWTHFDGSELLPVETDDNKDAVTKWKTDEAKARSLLTQRLPNVTVSKIAKIDTVAKRWKAIMTDFSLKNELLQAGLRQEFMDSRCPRGEFIDVYLSKLLKKRNNLHSYGVNITDDD
ncbi:hypothetical protein FISHEDRAFT_45351, partial [Fistulina hepatica ATCC 64428]